MKKYNLIYRSTKPGKDTKLHVKEVSCLNYNVRDTQKWNNDLGELNKEAKKPNKVLVTLCDPGPYVHTKWLISNSDELAELEIDVYDE